MPVSYIESTFQRLLGKIRINPYEPPREQSLPTNALGAQDGYIGPARANWLTAATLAVSSLSAIAIYLYHSRGLAQIGDPILDTLAAKSAAWIPFYRMASPSLILFMPRACRTAIGTCFLLIGVLCCINDFPVIFGGRAAVIPTIGKYPALAICITPPLLLLALELAHSNSRLTLTRNLLGWLAVITCVHGAFFLVGLMI